jgi:autotransporter adhesin
MNKAYRVILNKATGTWTAVSEIARGQGRGGDAIEASDAKRFMFAKKPLMSWVIGGCGFAIGNLAHAAGTEVGSCATAGGPSNIAINGTTTTYCASASGTSSVAIGSSTTAGDAGAGTSANGAVAVDYNQVAVGVNANAAGNSAIAMGADASVNGIAAGAFGNQANASANSALAMGEAAAASNTAATAVGALAKASGANAAALGRSAQATKDHSVALGANSVANRGAVAGVADPLSYSGQKVSTMVGEVSIGTSTATRQVTNVAAGTQASDAVNVAQVTAVKTVADTNAVRTSSALGGGSAIGADGILSTPTYRIGGSSFSTVGGALLNLDTRVAANNTAIGTAQTQLDTLDSVAAKYDDTSQETLTLDGASGTKVTNLQDATLSSVSTDAVTGRQLVATNTAVENLSSTVDGMDTRVTTAEGNIGSIHQNISDLSKQISEGLLVKQDAMTNDINVATTTSGTKVNFAGTAGNRVLAGVAAGDVSAKSNQAVNGAQLHGTAASTASALGGGSTVNADGTITAPSYSVGDTTVNTVEDAIGNLDERAKKNTGDISDLTTQINTGAVGLVQQDATSGEINVATATGGAQVNFGGTAGNRVLAGVAAGEVSATSNQAVNGAQLHGTAASTALALGGGSTVSNDGTITAPTYSVGGQDVHTVGDAVGNLDGRVTKNTGDISDLTTQINTGAVGLVQQDATSGEINVATATGGAKVNFGGTAGNRVLAGVAAGEVIATSNQAVNGAQLHGAAASTALALGGLSTVNVDGTITAPTYRVGGAIVNNVGDAIDKLDGRVTQNTSAIESIQSTIIPVGGSVANAVQYDPAAHDQVTLGGTDAASAIKVTNLQDGELSATSSDAVNGSQLYSTNQQVADLNQRVANNQATGNAGVSVSTMVAAAAATGESSVALGDSSLASGANAVAIGSNAQAVADNSVALGQGSVADQENTVSVGSLNNERRIANVADGHGPTDAVNMRQFQQGLGAVARNAYSGVAAATALALIPDVDPGRALSIGIGTANFKGYQAAAVGASARVSSNLKVRVGAGVSAAGTTWGAGGSYQW